MASSDNSLATVDTNPDAGTADAGSTASDIVDAIQGAAAIGVETWGAISGTPLTTQKGVAIPQQRVAVGTVAVQKTTVLLVIVLVVAAGALVYAFHASK